jgi:TonB family protein
MIAPAISRVIAALTLLLPLNSLASEVEFPELGVAIRNLPDLAAKPRVVEVRQGHAGYANFSASTISVYRQDAVVASGDLNDPGYRRTLLTAVGGLDEAEDGSLISIGSQLAWINLAVERASATPLVRKMTIYAVADQHLYRFLLTTNEARTPGEFDPILRAVRQTTSFAPVRRAMPSDGGANPHARALPRFADPDQFSGYPDVALRRREQGVVDVQFEIDREGHAQNVTELQAAYPELADGVSKMLQHLVFEVPRDWEKTGSDQRRFTVEVQFALVNRITDCPRGSQTVLVVCATRPS